MNVPGVRALLVAVLCRSALTISEPYAPQRGSCRAVTDYLEPNIGICCRKCEPGYYAERRCNLSMDTSCMPCPPGEYTEFWNYVRECKLCQSCDQRRELVVGVNCTTTARTVCECRSGYHCIEDTDCTECERHSPCSPGQELAQPGNTMEDTKCRVCPPGTFQKQVSLGKCRRHKNCTARRLIEVRAGSPKSDAVCEKVALKPSRIPPLLLVGSTTSIGSTTKSVDPPSSNSYLLIIVIAMTILCLCVIVAGFALYVRSRIRKKGQKRNTDTKAVEDVDGTSLESKQPLIDEKQPSPPTHRPMCASVPGGAGPREAQGRLDTDCLSQTCPGDRGGSGAPCQIPANGPGLDPEPRGRAHCQDPPRPYPQPRPEGPTRPGGQADIFAAHGVLGLQGCHVNNFESKLTVNGPLYIYNGPALAGQTAAPPPEVAEPPRASCCQEAGGPDPEPSGWSHEKLPVPEEDRGRGTASRVEQEQDAAPEYGHGGAKLVTAHQEEYPGPGQQASPQSGGQCWPTGSGYSTVVDLAPPRKH